MQEETKNKKDKQEKKHDESILLLEKGKKGLLRFFFGHALLTVVLLLVQIAIFAVLMVALQNYMAYYLGITRLIVFGFMLWLFNRPGNPMFHLSWALLILLSPVVGGVSYLVYELDLGTRAIKKRLGGIVEKTRGLIKQDAAVISEVREKSECTAGLCDYVRNTGAFPVCRNQGVKYFPLGEDYFEELVKRIEGAKKFIFLEYFIIEEGYMWGRILKLLEEKVKEGVEVRVIYDGLCSVILLPVKYPKQLKKLGIKCKIYSKLRFLFSTSYNNRDHRKIAVIDGEYGFTGGINLADEYINRKVRFGHWKDTGIMVKGQAVKNMTLMFLQMWSFDERTEEDYEKFLGASDLVNSEAGFEAKEGYLQPFADNPFDGEQVGMRIYLDAINRAEKYVNIMTPYLVLDYEMMEAIKYASKRGVRVNVILPHIPDKKAVFAVARTHYRELLAAGVHVYEYTPGFVHAKCLTADGNTAVVGSINFDYRSFYLHFECGVYMYGVPEIADIEKDVEATIEISEAVVSKKFGFKDYWLGIFGAFMKIFSPLI